eukprot:Sspe_Gene.78978::Locus_49472_Transcript_1_1_Confidence_1.000_Length_1156::g.78978::m.78978
MYENTVGALLDTRTCREEEARLAVLLEREKRRQKRVECGHEVGMVASIAPCKLEEATEAIDRVRWALTAYVGTRVTYFRFAMQRFRRAVQTIKRAIRRWLVGQRLWLQTDLKAWDAADESLLQRVHERAVKSRERRSDKTRSGKRWHGAATAAPGELPLLMTVWEQFRDYHVPKAYKEATLRAYHAKVRRQFVAHRRVWKRNHDEALVKHRLRTRAALFDSSLPPPPPFNPDPEPVFRRPKLTPKVFSELRAMAAQAFKDELRRNEQTTSVQLPSLTPFPPQPPASPRRNSAGFGTVRTLRSLSLPTAGRNREELASRRSSEPTSRTEWK